MAFLGFKILSRPMLPPPALVAGFLLFCSFSVGSMAEESPTPEYKLKAMFLYNFAQFVEWPYKEHNQSDFFTIGILGQSPFGNFLEEGLKNEKLRGKSIRIKRSASVQELQDCDLVFICKSESGKLTASLDALPAKGVLKVSDIPNFANQGGTIEIFLESGKVRFAINISEAKKSELAIGAKLLRLGKIVQE